MESSFKSGILDTKAATNVVEELGGGTFALDVLSMAVADDGVASVPVDAWTQMVLCCANKIAEAGLEPPTSYANVVVALEALHNPLEMYEFAAATKVDENVMSQAFEHVFLANGDTRTCPPHRKGNYLLLSDEQ